MALLSQQIIDDILKNTGANQDGKINRVLKGDFKRFDFQIKKKEKIDLSVFENGLSLIRQNLEKDWRLHYMPECALLRETERFVDLLKYPLRATSLCTQYKTGVLKESFLVYMGLNTFYCLLNDYLGGEKTKSDKRTKQLTNIENVLFKQVMDRVGVVISEAFNNLEKLDLKMNQLVLDNDQQNKEFVDKHLMAEYYFLKDEEDFKIALAIPASFLDLIEEKMVKSSTTVFKREDPKWQKAVTNAFFKTDLELKVSLGKITIPFEKSLTMSQGDIFSWEKTSPEVLVYQEDHPRIRGTLGIVGENFAIRVEELMK